jgi:hypothetical protein
MVEGGELHGWKVETYKDGARTDQAGGGSRKD